MFDFYFFYYLTTLLNPIDFFPPLAVLTLSFFPTVVPALPLPLPLPALLLPKVSFEDFNFLVEVVIDDSLLLDFKVVADFKESLDFTSEISLKLVCNDDDFLDSFLDLRLTPGDFFRSWYSCCFWICCSAKKEMLVHGGFFLFFYRQ